MGNLLLAADQVDVALTRTVIEHVLERAETQSPSRALLSKVLKTRINDLVREFSSEGDEVDGAKTIFPALKTDIEQIYRDIRATLDEERQASDRKRWDEVYLRCRARVSREPWPAGAYFERLVVRYSAQFEVQHAYRGMCEAIYKIGDALLGQPRGMYLDARCGCYFLSNAGGGLRLYQTHKVPRPRLEVFDPVYCVGVGLQDLREFAADAVDALETPVYKRERMRGLLDALVVWRD